MSDNPSKIPIMSFLHFCPRMTPGLAVAVFVLAPSVYWIFRDQSVWPWDMAWYGQVSLELWTVLSSNPLVWLRDMVGAFGTKAPGIAWVGQFFVPFREVVGSTETALLLEIIAAQFGTLLLSFQLFKQLSNGQNVAATASCVLLGSAPLFVAMSHQYLTEALQLLAVTYFFWIAAQANTWSRAQILGHLLLAADVAMLMKASSPLYCIFPGLVALWEVGRSYSLGIDASQNRGSNAMLFGPGLLIAGITAIWYYRNFPALSEFVRIASSGDIALDYGSKGTLLSKFQYWIQAVQKSMVLPEVLAAIIIALVVSLFVPVRWQTKDDVLKPSSRLNVLAAAALAQIAFTLLVFSLNINEEQRYLLPLAPAFLVLIMWCICAMHQSWVWWLVLCVASWQWVDIHAQAMGSTSRRPSVSGWLQAITWDPILRNAVDNAVHATCNSHSKERLNVVGVELPWFNYNTLSFYAAKAQLSGAPHCMYAYLGHAEKDLETAWGRLKSVQPVFFLSVRESELPEPPDFLNQTTLGILQRVRCDPDFTFTEMLNDRVLIFRNLKEFARSHSIRVTGSKALSPLSSETRARYSVNYETVVSHGLVENWLHPLPPATGQPTTFAINVERIAGDPLRNGAMVVRSAITIEHPNSEAVTFSIALRSEVDGRGELIGETRKTIRPADGQVQIEVAVPNGAEFQSIVLGTEMAPGGVTNSFAHAKFSDIMLESRGTGAD